MLPLEIIQGSRPGPVRAYKPSQDPTGSLPGTVRGPGGYPASFSSKLVPVSLADPGRGPAEPLPGSSRGLIRGLFIAGARVTFKLELKVTRGPRGVKKIDGTRSGSRPVLCGRDGQKKDKKSPGTTREGPFCEL